MCHEAVVHRVGAVKKLGRLPDGLDTKPLMQTPMSAYRLYLSIGSLQISTDLLEHPLTTLILQEFPAEGTLSTPLTPYPH